MSKNLMLKLRKLLLKRKTEIVNQMAQLEMGLKDQEEPMIEPGDAAQKEDKSEKIGGLLNGKPT